MSQAAPRPGNEVRAMSYNGAVIGHGARVRSYWGAGSFAAVRRRPFGGQRLRRAAAFRGAWALMARSDDGIDVSARFFAVTPCFFEATRLLPAFFQGARSLAAGTGFHVQVERLASASW